MVSNLENKTSIFSKNVIKMHLKAELWGFIGDRLQIPVSHLSKESVTRELSVHSIREESISNFTAVLDDCELARFAPAGIAKSDEEIYKNGMLVIIDLEEQIKS